MVLIEKKPFSEASDLYMAGSKINNFFSDKNLSTKTKNRN